MEISVSDAAVIEGESALKFVDRFIHGGSSLKTPRGLALGYGANKDSPTDLFVVSAETDSILRYDAKTGEFLGTYIAPGLGGLDSPGDLAFDANKHLFVTSINSNALLEYDAAGQFVRTVATGLSLPLGLDFGANGSLYIANQDADQILKYDGTSVSTLIDAGSGGLDRPRQAVVGPDGDLYVASSDTSQVLRYDANTGAPKGVFATNSLGTGMAWLEFGADGHLYATYRDSGTDLPTTIARFNGTTGEFIDSLQLGRDGWAFIVGPDNLIYNSWNDPQNGSFVERFGPSSLEVFTIQLSRAGSSTVTVRYATADATAIAGSDYAESSGVLSFAPGETTKTVLVSTFDDSIGEFREAFALRLSNAVGGTIVDGSGTATIRDDD